MKWWLGDLPLLPARLFDLSRFFVEACHAHGMLRSVLRDKRGTWDTFSAQQALQAHCAFFVADAVLCRPV